MNKDYYNIFMKLKKKVDNFFIMFFVFFFVDFDFVLESFF